MIQEKITALVHWLPNARKHPPTPPRYSTVARFGDQAHSETDEAWSVVLEFAQPADAKGNLVADIRLLSPDAPQALLQDGNRFVLYEGAKKVAEGEIVHSHST